MIPISTKDRLTKPIPKTSIGLSTKQKIILENYIGKSPKLPVELSEVRNQERKQGGFE